MDWIKCACGCGNLIPKFSKRGLPRKYIIGHTLKGKIGFSNEGAFKKGQIGWSHGLNKIEMQKIIHSNDMKRKQMKKCGCGCGKIIHAFDYKCRPKRFYPKHENIGRSPSKETRMKLSKSNGRENSINWKGGSYICPEGYTWIKTNVIGFKTRKGYIKRCKQVWYDRTGEIINPPYMLHHINRDRKDDSFKNLVKTTQKEHHRLYHLKKESRIY